MDFYRVEDFKPEESFASMMRQIVSSMIHQADDLLKPSELTSAQRSLLLGLKIAGRSKVSELARSLQVDAGATTRLVDRLVRSGHCQRWRSDTDRREVFVELTEEGAQAITEVPAALCEVMNAHLAGFSETELGALKTYLLRIKENGKTQRSG